MRNLNAVQTKDNGFASGQCRNDNELNIIHINMNKLDHCPLWNGLR